MKSWSNEFVRNFKGLVLLSNGNVYIGIGSIATALTWMRDANVVVLGMEGVTTDGDTVQSLTECIADFSEISGEWTERVRRSHDAALITATAWRGTAQFVEVVTVATDV